MVLVVNQKYHVMHALYITIPYIIHMYMHCNANECKRTCLKGQHGMEDIIIFLITSLSKMENVIRYGLLMFQIINIYGEYGRPNYEIIGA